MLLSLNLDKILQNRVNNNQLQTNKYLYIAVGIIAIVASYVIIYSINNRIKVYIDNVNSRIPDQLAFLLANEIEEWIVPKTGNFELSRLNQYNRNNPRIALKRFVQRNPNIKAILLISPENRIVLSTLPSLEDQVYTREEELELLKYPTPKVTLRTENESANEYDVLWPVNINGEFKGFIRLVLDINQLHNLDEIRRYVVWGAAVAVSLLIAMAIWVAWQMSQAFKTQSQISDVAEHEAGVHSALAKPIITNGGSQSVFAKLKDEFPANNEIEQSFQQSEQKAHSMMRVLNQGLMVLDSNMHILSCNEYLLDVFQIRTKSNYQRKVYEILQKNPRLLEIYRRAKDPLIMEVKQHIALTLLNNHIVNVEVLAQPFLDQHNHIQGVMFYLKNLDMLHELEQTLQRSMKYGVISQLSSSIGHEIRNPLSSLAIHTEIVDSMVERSVTDQTRKEKIKKSIGILNSEVERLNKLIDQFFNLAKAQQIQLTYENINEIMNDIIGLVSQQALEKTITIDFAPSKDLPMIKVSKDQLKQVIINIILNAFDAMKEGGELRLSTSYRDRFVVIAIKDNGSGIPDSIKDHIFDLYFTTKETGGGIGLAIPKKIIEAHEGNLYFESTQGKGTVFYIELPTTHS